MPRGGGSAPLMLTNGTSFNSSSTFEINGTPFTLPIYSSTWQYGSTFTTFFAAFDKVTYGTEEYLNVSTFYKTPSSQSETPPIQNKYGYLVQNNQGSSTFGPFIISIGQNFYPIIWFSTNRFSSSATTKNEMALSSKIINFSNFRLLSFNAPTLLPPFLISDIVYSDDPSVDNRGTSITFTWNTNNNRYESSYVNVIGSPENPNMNNGFAFVFYNSPTKYIGLVSNNTVIVWLRGTIPSINSSPVNYGNFNIPPVFFNFSSILPNLYS